VPHIRSARQRRKLLAAYSTARAEFLEIVASAIGGKVVVIDMEAGTARLSAVIEPPVLQ